MIKVSVQFQFALLASLLFRQNCGLLSWSIDAAVSPDVGFWSNLRDLHDAVRDVVPCEPAAPRPLLVTKSERAYKHC
jgi:hypothetical protein